VVYLYYNKTIKPSAILNNITIFIGWLIALLLIFIQLKKNHEASIALNKEEIKKNYCIKAFETFNVEITNLSKTIIKVGNSYLSPLLYNPEIVVDQKELKEIVKSLNITNQFVILTNALSNFLITYEAYEIAFLEFKHYKEYIQLLIIKMEKELQILIDYLYSNNDEIYLQINQKVFVDKCNLINDMSIDLLSYLFDFRIEIMNKFMSDTFDATVPDRKPLKGSKKILREVAIKEEVEKEFSQLENQYINKSV
jgi:hypothetical protein